MTSKKHDLMSPEENNLLTCDLLIKFHSPPLKKLVLLLPEDKLREAGYIPYLLKTSDHNTEWLYQFILL